MTFEQWYSETYSQDWMNKHQVKKAWDAQQKRIDELEELLIENWTDDVDELYWLLEGKYTKEFLRSPTEEVS